MLKGKTIYCVVTGAHRTATIAAFLSMLRNNGASNIILIPTPAAISFLDFESISSDALRSRTFAINICKIVINKNFSYCINLSNQLNLSVYFV